MNTTKDNRIVQPYLCFNGSCEQASDGQCSGTTNFDGFSLSLSVATESEADKYFGALADGGKVCMPLAKTFWSPRFGMVVDRFGVSWMIMTVPPEGQK